MLLADPLPPADPLRRRAAAGPARARCRRPPARSDSAASGRRSTPARARRPCRPRSRRSARPGPSRSRRDPLQLVQRLLGAGGDHRRVRHGVERRAERVSQRGKLTSPPASRTISWPAAASTPRQLRSDTIPSNRAAATWHSDDGDRAQRPQPVGATPAAPSIEAATQRGSADSIPRTSSRPSRRGARRASGSSRGRCTRRPRRGAPTTPRRDRSRRRSRRRRRPSSRRRRRRSTGRDGAAPAWRSATRRSGR